MGSIGGSYSNRGFQNTETRLVINNAKLKKIQLLTLPPVSKVKKIHKFKSLLIFAGETRGVYWIGDMGKLYFRFLTPFGCEFNEVCSGSNTTTAPPSGPGAELGQMLEIGAWKRPRDVRFH